MDIVIISGMSGAGKSKALKALEDMGYYCVDNIMPRLVHSVIDTCFSSRESMALDKLAIGIDARGGVFFNGVFPMLEGLKKDGIRFRLLFLDASDNVLVNRYKETRREHPLAKGGLIQSGITAERGMLSNLRDIADIKIDTSNMSDGELRQTVYNHIPKKSGPKTDVTIVTFGFKRGTPMDCDFLYDVRFLPNPHHVPALRGLNGTNSEVAAYVYEDPAASKFVESVAKLTKDVLPLYQRHVKHTVVIGIGCTGGKHRSVATACHLSKLLSSDGFNVALVHRELFIE